MKKYVIIAAGGSGQRMGSSTPKQLLTIKNKPLLWYSVKAFVEAFDDIIIIVAAPLAYFGEIKNACADFSNVTLIEGGHTRFQSVKNGLAMVKEPSVVFVHDAV